MRKSLLLAAAASLLAATGVAHATSISSGGTLSGVTVTGQQSVYQVFGHPGNPGGDWGPDASATEIDFASGPHNVFTFSATGLVSCCSDSPNIPPDGGGSGMNVGGANGLSGLSGNGNIPLVGVFTSNTDPSLGSAPAALSFDKYNPASLAPALDQVFYIGDGRTGYNNGAGSLLDFTAPAGATRLYLGAIDAYGFYAQTGYYNDNNGAFSVDVHLAGTDRVGGVPEPATWAMMILGLGATGAMMRRRRTLASA